MLTFLLILSGCTGAAVSPDKVKSPILRVGYLSEDHFEQRFGNIVSLEFPNYRLEIVPIKDMIRNRLPAGEWVESNRLDLIYAPSSSFKDLIDSGSLVELDTYMKRDSFLEDAVIPSVMKLTRAYGNGNVYGLPTNFDSKVIVYNQDQFDRLKVPYLTDGMTWPELFNVIQRLDGGLSVHSSSPFHLLALMGQSEQLQMMNAQNQSVTLNNPAWNKLWDITASAVKNGGIYFDDVNENPFLTGERAAALISYDEYKVLEQNAPSFKWDMVMLPTAASLQGKTTSITADGYWAIPAGSSNPDEAWKLIQFFMSDKAAKWGYRSIYGFSTLVQQFSLNAENNGRLEAFYRGDPLVPFAQDWPDYLLGLVNDLFAKIVEGSISVDTGLQELQESITQRLNEVT
ncbi:ABC transporter substrate-binding protein [Paenibacillus xylaniclasticus]|uniref:ABC transporter substrate-binding protein n=1 Tax=Paenibacillus xylaniclasticus TaxID=588083 RepID=UPI000FDC6056|nr:MULTISPECIES: extracellular solute-binding protein [Paenibacillus]